MKKYTVIWQSVLEEGSGTYINYVHKIEFEDVQFKDFYIRATDDDDGKTYIIPYNRIYDIEITGETDDHSMY